jgi:hypothetical protein
VSGSREIGPGKNDEAIQILASADNERYLLYAYGEPVAATRPRNWQPQFLQTHSPKP